ncbi:MAG: ATP-binding protein [Planctomycetota bacterium]|jgi:two-component system phosphate regulon sensor histidine kinase PhoR
MIRAPRTLLWRLGATLICLQVVLLTVVGVYVASVARRFHYEQTSAQLDRLTGALHQRYAEALAAGRPDRVADLVASDRSAVDARITVVLADGAVAADSHHDPADMDDHGARPEILAARDRGRGTSVRFSATLESRMMYDARPVQVDGRTVAYVRTALPIVGVDAAVDTLLRALGVAALLSLVAIGLAMYVISRRLSGVVARLADGAARFAGGDLTHRVERPDARELAKLADALNSMAGELSRRLDELRTSHHEQQAILQSMSSGLIALDAEERVLDLNRAAERLLRVDAARARGRLLAEVVRQPELHRFVGEAVGGEEAGRAEFPLPGDPPVVVQAAAETLTDEDGRPKGVLVLLNDVTRLRRLETLRSDFAANVSHELRTPITNIKGYVETLRQTGVADVEQTGRFLEIIRKNSDRLTAIVEDVLALTRLEHPLAPEALERSPHSALALIRSVLGQYEAAAGARGIELRAEAAPDLELTVHPQLLEQALANLVSNAIRYSPDGTTVTVAARRRDDEVELSVADEGPGIAPEHVPRLFERFYRVDKARSRALGGTGLGLAIVKHIALVHGGRVDVDTDVGRGSTFRIVLPAA